MNKPTAKLITESAIMIGLATVLSLVKVFQAPFGGAVTLGSMVPIIVLALRWGAGVGITAGAAYGIIQLIMGPWIVHPIQVILDYPAAFGALGIAGFFPRQPAIAVSLAMLGRFISHFLAGIAFWTSTFPAGQNPIMYSFAYNAGYMFPELIISGIVIWLLRFGKIFGTESKARDS